MNADVFWLLFLGVAVFGAIMSGVPAMIAIAGASTLVALIASSIGFFDLTFLQAVPQRFLGIMTSPLLLAVPLFIFMGLILEKSKQAERMIKSLTVFFGAKQSSLSLAVLLFSALIAATTGVVGATIVMLGTLVLPVLLSSGVDQRTSSGLICASGSLGQIIPPSIVLILLGDQVSNAYFEAQREIGNFAPEPPTVSELFAGALFPGLLLVALYALFVFWKLRGRALRIEEQTSKEDVSWLNFLQDVLPTISLVVLVLGSILAGLATPTEAASLGAGGAVLVSAYSLGGRMRLLSATASVLFVLLVASTALDLLSFDLGAGNTLLLLSSIALLVFIGFLGVLFLTLLFVLTREGVLFPALRETVTLSGMIFGVVLAASILSLVFRGFDGDSYVAHLLETLPGGVWGMLCVTLLVIFLLGFVLEFVEIIFIVVPIVGPIILQSDISPIWFAILIAMNLQTSFLTPPFGFALFYFRSVAPANIKTSDLYSGVVPFIVLQLIALICVVAFPVLATGLPQILF